MIEFKSSGFGQARIWLGELPDMASYRATKAFMQTVRTGPSKLSDASSAAIELYIPMGGFASYGLLGGRYLPSHGDKLEIRIHISAPDGPNVPNSLGMVTDDVRAGLPSEYVGGVMDGLRTSAATVGAGQLWITHACHGIVGSNISVFRSLGQALGRIMAIEQPESGELQDILNIVCGFNVISAQEITELPSARP